MESSLLTNDLRATCLHQRVIWIVGTVLTAHLCILRHHLSYHSLMCLGRAFELRDGRRDTSASVICKVEISLLNDLRATCLNERVIYIASAIFTARMRIFNHLFSYFHNWSWLSCLVRIVKCSSGCGDTSTRIIYEEEISLFIDRRDTRL